MRRKNSSALQGRWLEEPEGFPIHVSFRKGNKTAIMAAAWQTKGALRPRKGNKTAIMAAAWRTKGALRPQNQNVMKCLQKQTNCSVLADFRDAAFAQSGPNSGFPRDFFAQNGAFVQGFVSVFYFLGSPARNFGAGTRNSEPRNSFFGARNFYFGARMKKSRYRNFFAAAPGAFFFPVGTFPRTRSPCHFVGGIPRRAFPPVGFLRRECPVFRQKGRFGGNSATF